MSIASIILNPRGIVDPANSNPDNDAQSQTTGHVLLQLDALVSEAPHFAAAATKSKVETGATINDHVTTEPMKLLITGIVSNTAVSLKRSPSSLFNGPSPAQQAFDYIKSLWLNRQVFDFVGTFGVYKNMVITNFIPSRNKDNAGALQFTCGMEQILTVDTDVIPDYQFANAKKSAPKRNKGTHLTVAASTPQTAATETYRDPQTGYIMASNN